MTLLGRRFYPRIPSIGKYAAITVVECRFCSSFVKMADSMLIFGLLAVILGCSGSANAVTCAQNMTVDPTNTVLIGEFVVTGTVVVLFLSLLFACQITNREVATLMSNVFRHA
jgi:hypothetical protein